MAGLPKGFTTGVLAGGIAALVGGLLADRRLRTTLAYEIRERGESIPFAASRLYAAFVPRLMAGAYRTIAEEVVSEARSGELLELGSGPGQLAVEIARRARDLEITAMDLSSDMVQMAESRVHAAGLGRQVKVARGDAREIPFLAESFDFVLSLAILRPWRDPGRVLGEIHRILRPGGKAWIYAPWLEMPEKRGVAVHLKIPLQLGQLFNWVAYSEGEIASWIAKSPFGQGRIETSSMEYAGTPVRALAKITLQKEVDNLSHD